MNTLETAGWLDRIQDTGAGLQQGCTALQQAQQVGVGVRTRLVDSWPYFGHGQDAGLNLFWAEIADTYASDQPFLNTLLQSCPGLLKRRIHFWAWLHR